MSAVVVRPVRFTDDVKAMQAFFEALGLRPRIEAEAGGWVDMVAGGGMVALHSAATSASGGKPGQTSLSFEADDLTSLAKRLEAAGVDRVRVYDEAYGQVLTCSDPLGNEIHVDGRSGDLYGYRVHSLGPTPPLRVSPVLFTDPQGSYCALLEALGLTRRGKSNEYYVTYTAGGGDRGLVGLHYVYADDLPLVAKPGAATAQLNFETAEALDDMARRLAASGFEAPITRQDFGSFLTVTDPDGQQVQIHERPIAE
jgi:predicted enzyme related to lactoylglutathione lyase